MHSSQQNSVQDQIPRILIIEDEPQDIKILAGLLKEKGYQVRVARKPEQALKSLKTETVELILLDIRMPGMSGFEVCENLKENAYTENIPVIFLTAVDETEEKVKGLELGAVDYITKPFDLDEVAARVSRQLKLKSEYNRNKGQGEYHKTSLDQQTRHEICRRLADYFEEEAPYLSGELSAVMIADKIGVSQHNLSEAVNLELQQNISSFINSYRIDYFCKLAYQQPDTQILILAYKSGYNSKSVFNRWFKTIKKTTPRKFIQSLRH